MLSKKRKSTVYRLEGADAAGAIIAKRCGRDKALLERTLYEEVLIHLPVQTLRFHGCVEEPKGDIWWLFMEEAGGETYSSLLAEHRRLAAQWLGAAHAHSARLSATVALPERGLPYYLDHLRLLRKRIAAARENPALEARHREVLDRIESQCDRVDSSWADIVALGGELPRTLVHGDLSPKNVRVRSRDDRSSLLPFDWENAGWGVPAADVAHLYVPPRDHLSLRPDLEVYWIFVRTVWPHLTLRGVEMLATLGTLLRLVSLMNWASMNLDGTRPGKAIRTLRFYEDALSAAHQRLVVG